jgi:hypothetical protein
VRTHYIDYTCDIFYISAMTTSKWDLLGEEDNKQEEIEDLDGQ